MEVSYTPSQRRIGWRKEMGLLFGHTDRKLRAAGVGPVLVIYDPDKPAEVATALRAVLAEIEMALSIPQTEAGT